MRLGEGWFLLVNREYKPLGHFSDCGDLDTQQAKVRIKGLTDAKAERLGLKIGGHLYDDGTNPQASAANWRRYEAMLAKLMKLEIDHANSGRTRGRIRRRMRSRNGLGREPLVRIV
jgi:hypothetical protein